MKIIYVLLFTLLLNLSVTAQVIPLATGEWEPYTGEKLTNYGFFTELVTAVCKSAGLEPKYTFYPWARAENELSAGKIFGIFPYVVTEERKKEFVFSDVLSQSRGVFFYEKARINGVLTYKDLKDLKRYKIGGVIGYWYESLFKENDLNVEYIADESGNFRKLSAGRVDIVISDELVGWQYISKIFPGESSKFAASPTPLNSSELHVMISKNYPDYKNLQDKFNGGIKKIKSDGTYSAILKKYGLAN